MFFGPRRVMEQYETIQHCFQGRLNGTQALSLTLGVRLG